LELSVVLEQNPSKQGLKLSEASGTSYRRRSFRAKSIKTRIETKEADMGIAQVKTF